MSIQVFFIDFERNHRNLQNELLTDVGRREDQKWTNFLLRI
jgi:hypothetical protein